MRSIYKYKADILNYNLTQLTSLRHWLHAHPEVSRNEVETAKYLRDFIESFAKPDEIVELDDAGFAVVYNGEQMGNTVMIRAELDALPIHEINDDINYRSLYDGVGHKCGHDGHMTILAGLAQTLSVRPKTGRVVLLFQPDEETGTGAKNCALSKDFKHIEPDFVFALHNLPGFPKGEVICKTGTFASAVRYVAIKMSGKEAHSAQPETGASPAFALAELTLKTCEIQQKYSKPDAYALIVPVYNEMGVQASGVCPGYGEAHYTLRAANADSVEVMWHELWQYAQTVSIKYGLKIEFEVRESFTATANSSLAFDMIKQAAIDTGSSFNEIKNPFRWGEDFGELTQRYEGGMFGLGAGLNQPDLHNPDYDFPDDLLENGIKMFEKLTKNALLMPILSKK